jgi:hypothetical protein
MNIKHLSSIVIATPLILAGVTYATEAKADMVKIMSKAACSAATIAQGDVGHSAIAFYDANGRVTTKGMWPDGVKTNNSTDMAMANGQGCGLKTRTAYVTPARRQWIQDQVASPGGTNCRQYFPVGKVAGSDQFCSCVNFATRVWRQTTSDWERWQFQSTPKLLGDTIWFANGWRNHGVFNGGKVW